MYYTRFRSCIQTCAIWEKEEEYDEGGARCANKTIVLYYIIDMCVIA